jgi:mono/diheme cytochrome c family protein
MWHQLQRRFRAPMMSILMPGVFLVSGLANGSEELKPKQPSGQAGAAPYAPRPLAPAAAMSFAKTSAPVKPDPKMLHVQALYRRNCQRCHGEDGSGTKARARMPSIPDFTNESWQRMRKDALLVASILDGKGTNMPQFGDKLSQGDVRKLVAHIRALDPPGANQKDIPEGDYEKRFRRLQQELEELRKEFRTLAAPVKP